MSEGYIFNTYEDAMKAVELWNDNIRFVDPDLITPEMALIAVKWNGYYLEFIPAHCQTQEVIEVALKQNPLAKQYIKIKEMFKNALEEALGE